jgi:two-component system nitrogen regulation sensor histidine kinase GlnL
MVALGAMLAHEIKNPLAGIRGAAQLLEQSAAEDERVLDLVGQHRAERHHRAGRAPVGELAVHLVGEC